MPKSLCLALPKSSAASDAALSLHWLVVAGGELKPGQVIARVISDRPIDVTDAGRRWWEVQNPPRRRRCSGHPRPSSLKPLSRKAKASPAEIIGGAPRQRRGEVLALAHRFGGGRLTLRSVGPTLRGC